ncbi:putative bifunctional diguanylate cyclase/phosphodiesterase [Consotaella salsifontis]|uniref:Diguanylate cyclase (GGDEF) domain-containing protein n=1 Tax=Consotaella salsifontis TaxID=1365950 RepID=A0A1T4RD96_9HYPH|nr:EAL domain-containing protein [Consotaella salsifontis]SKA13925.1 diguanylate cyclase (GGDEF) domain-containing protein [Consotaella salsifontis]
MPIRWKLLIACLALILADVAVAQLAIESQGEVRRSADRLYEHGMVSLDHLRSAQGVLSALSTTFEAREGQGTRDSGPLRQENIDVLLDGLTKIDETLQQSAAIATSEKTHGLIDEVRVQLSRLRASGGAASARKVVSDLAIANDEIATIAAAVLRDGRTTQRAVYAYLDQFRTGTWRAAGIAATIAILVFFLLGRTIVAPIKRATRIINSIAAKSFDNQIITRGRSETAQLLRALDAMQTSIAGQITGMEKERKTQAANLSGTIAIQGARWEAALNNMSQGLCLFDRDLKLMVHNKRFEQMFGARRFGLTSREMLDDPFLHHVLAPSEGAFFTAEMPDGRVIAISRQWIEGGGLVATLEDITERHIADQKMRHLARHDALTDLPNRLRFRERLEKLFGMPGVALLSLDLDGFKTVNDTLGHPVGDRLLKAVSARLCECVGKRDLLARTGGDEFAVIQVGVAQPESAEALAKRLIAALAAPFDIEHHKISIGVSIGIVVNSEKETGTLIDPDALLKDVDLALYSAKAAGRNAYRFFKPEMAETIERRRRMEIDLRRAVEADEFELFYQPFYDVARGTISGFEALIRWRHPERGLVSPGEFIPIAEEVGLIDAMGLWALEAACRQAAQWPSQLSISVNLSPIQFRDPDLSRRVEDILNATGLPPSRLQLEVTESLMLEDDRATLAVLQAFRARGIRLSMDDFGTGYSSLGYLTKFPFDKVKIDQSFVRHLTEPENIAVVRAVIGLSRSMGISVIAEGVETSEHYDVLEREGCREMQGYFFSPPVPALEVAGLLMRFRPQPRMSRPAGEADTSHLAFVG